MTKSTRGILSIRFAFKATPFDHPPKLLPEQPLVSLAHHPAILQRLKMHRVARKVPRFPTRRRPPSRSLCAEPSQPAAPSRAPVQGPISWKALALFGGLGTAGLAYYSIEKQRRMEQIMRPKTLGKAAIGGPFELADEHGALITEQALLGRWSLVYFGFTMCPDVCPEELTKVSEALAVLEKHGRKVAAGGEATITPVFITIDPERDSPARAAEYARGFHSGFVGLGGSLEQVRAAAKAYRVYFSKDDTAGNDYLVDHSIITYLMDPKGNFVEFYGKNSSAVEMAARIEAKMLAYKE